MEMNEDKIFFIQTIRTTKCSAWHCSDTISRMVHAMHATLTIRKYNHVGLFETYRYKRTGQIFKWNYIGNWYAFSKYLDDYCRYQYSANDTLFRNISCILRSIFQDILQQKKKDVAFCETTDTAHSYIKQIVTFSEIKVSIDAYDLTKDFSPVQRDRVGR